MDLEAPTETLRTHLMGQREVLVQRPGPSHGRLERHRLLENQSIYTLKLLLKKPSEKATRKQVTPLHCPQLSSRCPHGSGHQGWPMFLPCAQGVTVVAGGHQVKVEREEVGRGVLKVRFRMVKSSGLGCGSQVERLPGRRGDWVPSPMLQKIKSDKFCL